MSDLKVVELPRISPVDIAKALRELATAIENGDHGEAHNLAWVVDEGNSITSVGLMGGCGEPGSTAYYLLGLGMRQLEGVR